MLLPSSYFTNEKLVVLHVNFPRRVRKCSPVYWSPRSRAEGVFHLMRIVSLPGAPTGADVSFFSTLGCSLRGALTSGSMALALLSPFIWSERALAPVPPVCRWPCFHLASPLFPCAPLTAGCHNQQQTDDKSLGSTATHALRKHTHTRLCGERLWCIWILTPCAHTFFSSPPSTTVSPPSYTCLSQPALTLRLGFFSLSLRSLESARSGSSIWRETSCGPEKI